MIRPFLIVRFLSALLIMIGLSMFAPWGIALWKSSGEQTSFLYPILISLSFGGILLHSTPSFKGQSISHREAFIIVALGWFFTGGIAALPFWFFGLLHNGSHYFPDYTSAYFEAISGLTTTGATILPSIQDLPASILFWRALTHWLGGMGIILLGVAILPFLGIGGMQLFRAEVPGPTADKLSPRIAETAKSLWLIYLLLTVVEILLLMLGGMSLFDAICHSFATLATGGFSTQNISIEAYHSLYFEIVISTFMFLAGMNFALHFFWLRGKFESLWKNEEFRFYTSIVVIWSVSMAVILQLTGFYKTFGESLRYTSFQVISILTSTGFSSYNFDLWRTHSSFATAWLVTLMFIGGCAGSTGGGIKVIRIWLLFKVAHRELARLTHPRAIFPVKIENQVVSEEILSSITGFFALYLLSIGIATVTMTYFNLDLLSALMAVLASIGNIGPGLAKVGPYANYAFIPITGKWVLIFCMLLGRLELYTILILLVPQFWKR